MNTLVGLGARIPEDLKKRVSTYCDRHGIKMQFFVTQALQDHLAELEEDVVDNTIIDGRIGAAQFTDSSELEKYVQSRKAAA